MVHANYVIVLDLHELNKFQQLATTESTIDNFFDTCYKYLLSAEFPFVELLNGFQIALDNEADVTQWHFCTRQDFWSGLLTFVDSQNYYSQLLYSRLSIVLFSKFHYNDLYIYTAATANRHKPHTGTFTIPDY